MSNGGGWAGKGTMDAGPNLGSAYDKMPEVFGAYGELVESPNDIHPEMQRAVA